MEEVNITELRQRLPTYIEQVRRGKELNITVRGKVVARLVPMADQAEAARRWLEALRRSGKAHVGDVIGSLQTNKARDAVRLFDCIHSVDRIDLARELDRRARQAARVVDVLVQVNIGEEPQKGGAAPDDGKRLLDTLRPLAALRVRGLMTIPPVTRDAEEARPWFRRLRELRDATGVEHLSMGMTADFQVAIEEGATMIRVGTAIFGPRAPGAGAAGRP